MKQIIPILEKAYKPITWGNNLTAFESLIAIILSQNTSDKNSIPAFHNLKKKFKITPQVLSKANKKSIATAIKSAGLHNQKADTIKKIAKELLKKDLKTILKLPTSEARVELIKLPGVGNKPADVVLSFVAGKDTFPVDTHIWRITERLGLVGQKNNYAQVSEAWKRIVPPANRGKIHVALIWHGREICKARKPKCKICPINKYCKYYNEHF